MNGYTSTISTNKDQDSIFNFGKILNRVSDISFDSLEKVAPVWLADQLNINQRIPVAVDPTYQNTDPQRQPSRGLTSNEESLQNQQSPVFAVKQSTLLLGGFVALAALLFLRDNS